MSRFSVSAAPAITAVATAILLAGCGGGGGTSAKALSASSACQYNADTSVAVTGQLSALVSGDSSGSVRYAITESPANGDVSIAANTGAYSYLANSSGQGDMDQFRFEVIDGGGQRSSGVVQVINGALRIMPVGDSITFGVESFNATTGDLPLSDDAVGYRQPLYDLLVDNGYAVSMVGPQSSGSSAGLTSTGHAGYPGWTSTQIDANFDTWLVNHTPDVALIHAGTNDHGSDVSEVVSMLNRADTWRSSNHALSLLVAQIIQPRADGPYSADPVDTFNQNIANFVSSDARFEDDTVVDQKSALDRNTDMTPSPADSTGLHPNASGYAKMAQTWYDSLVASGTANKCPA